MLSDDFVRDETLFLRRVSMHLLVLSAFRRYEHGAEHLNALVSMHLLVLSAFRPKDDTLVWRDLGLSQCTFWCSVLSDLPTRRTLLRRLRLNAPFGAQCFPTL